MPGVVAQNKNSHVSIIDSKQKIIWKARQIGAA